MTRPVIAVTAMRSDRVEGLRRTGHAVSEKVLQAVLRAGGTPLVISPETPVDDVPLGIFDGVLIPGGADMDPELWGGSASDAQGKVDRLHDEFEIELVRRVVAAGVPLLAICRGMQVLNVALGGTLIGDLPVNSVPHRNGYHRVTLDETSQLAQTTGATQIEVSAYHHQAVDRLGSGLRVVGHADDGCVEAIEHENGRVLGVQWHPEDDAARVAHDQVLFHALVGMSSAAPV